MAHPDVPVFPPVAEGHPGLRLPSPAVADSHPGAVSLSDADRGAVRRACLDMVGAIPEDHCLPDPLAVAVEKLAVHGPRPADAVPGHPDPAWAECLELPASDGLAERWAQLRVVVAPCIRAEDQSAA